MKKRLLTQILALTCVMGAYALNEGDYIYSPTAKFKVTGANIVTNGDFSVGDGYEGWSNIDGGPVAANWAIKSGLGPNGEPVIMSEVSSADSVAYLCRSWQLDAGTYTVSFWIQGETAGVTTVGVVNNSGAYTTPGDNYINFFVAETGTYSIKTPILTGQNFDTNWKQIVGNVTLNEPQTVAFAAKAVATGTCLTGFEIYPVQSVFDTRILERWQGYMQRLYEDPDLPVEKEILEEPLAAIGEFISAEGMADDEAVVADVLVLIQESINNFLDANAGDTESGDWSTHGYSNWNNINNNRVVGSWSTIGVRWGFSPNDESLERPADDGYVLTAGIQRSYNLENVGVKVVREDLPPGKYFFQIEAQATAAANNAAPYGSNSARPIVGPTLWVGTDTLTLENDTISGDYWKTFYLIREVKEGETVEAGFLFPTYDDSMGGRYSLRNPQFRWIGKNVDEVHHFLRVAEIVVQEKELKNRLDNYANDVKDLYWGKDSLVIAQAQAQAVYDDAITVVTPEGETAVQPTEEGVNQLVDLREALLAEVNNMGRAKNWMINMNNIQGELRSTIADANASLENEGHAKADAGLRTNLQSCVATGQALIDAIAVIDDIEATTAKNAEHATAKQAIRDARQDFEMSCATRAFPAELQCDNLNFEAWTSKSTYSSDREVNGWSFLIGTDGKQWDVAPNAAFKKGHSAGIWRGTSVGPNGKAVKKVTISKPGVYEFRSRAYSAEYGDQSKWAEYMNVAQICGSVFDWDTFDLTPADTVYHPNVRLFFGPDGATNDSITVSKCAPEDYLTDTNGTLVYTRGTAMVYSIIYLKTTDTEETVEFGLEAFENGATSGANTFGFGDNLFNYLGKVADYEADTEAELQATSARAKEYIAKYGPTVDDDPTSVDANVGWIAHKLMRLVNDTRYPWTEGYSYVAPANVQDKQNVILTLNEYMEMIDLSTDPSLLGIEDVNTDAQTVNRQQLGTYTLSGVKVTDARNLKPGFYIINGKKIVIK